MTAETTGQEVLDRVSEAEAACLSAAVDDADYNALLGGSVLSSYGNVGDLDLLFSCLTGDNFVLFGVGFTSARARLTDESHACRNALDREHPAAVVTFLDIETPPEAVAALPACSMRYHPSSVVPYLT